MYTCKKCGSNDHYTYKRSGREGQTYDTCKPCALKRRDVWAKGPGRAAVNASSRKTWKTLREQVYAAYGNACTCCGETEQTFLTIDHVNGDGTKHRKEIGGADKLYRVIRAAGFPNDYTILCHNCNSGRWRNGGICAHKFGILKVVAGNAGSRYFPE